MPPESLLAEMGKYHEELQKAGVLLDGNGLQASSKGLKVKYTGKKRSIVNGPFTGVEGPDRRLHHDPDQDARGGQGMVAALPEPDHRRLATPRSKCGRCSSPRISRKG